MRYDKRYSQAKLYSIYTETSKKCTLIERFRSSLDLNFQHLKNMGQMHPFCHKSLTLDKHPSTVSVSVSSETRSTEFEQRDPAFLPSPFHPPINVPSSYRFFNRAPYCRRGIVRVSRERSRLIRHRKTG